MGDAASKNMVQYRIAEQHRFSTSIVVFQYNAQRFRDFLSRSLWHLNANDVTVARFQVLGQCGGWFCEWLMCEFSEVPREIHLHPQLCSSLISTNQPINPQPPTFYKKTPALLWPKCITAFLGFCRRHLKFQHNTIWYPVRIESPMTWAGRPFFTRCPTTNTVSNLSPSGDTKAKLCKPGN